MSSSAWVGAIDGVEHIVRVPVGDGKRPTPDYTGEARLLDDLHERGAPIAPIRIVRVDGHDCSIARRVQGRPVNPDDWTDELVQAVARFLTILHATAPDLAVEPDIVRRFHLAPIWPFDDSRLADHAVSRIWPDRVAELDARRGNILAAAAGPRTVVHTDLHPQHLIVAGPGQPNGLVGVLDFGDAFAGVAAWDHACLRYYHGDNVEQRVAIAMGGSAPAAEHVDFIGIAWALYKLAKTPDRVDIRERVDRLLSRGLA